jgi:hypothetical protein
MASTQYSQTFESVGLTTLTFSVPVAGSYTLFVKTTIPTLTNGGGVSQCVTTVKQNGTTIYTSTAGAQGFQTAVTCALNDTLSVAYSSAATPDQGLNVIKSTVSIG